MLKEKRMGAKKSTATGKLQVSLDVRIIELLDELAAHGFLGSARSEVAGWILHEWVWDNYERMIALNVVQRVSTGASEDG